MKMKSWIVTLFAVMTVAALSANAYAAFTVTPALSSKTLTENEQATVMVSVKNLAGSAENNIVVQLAGGWFSVISQCPIISTLQAGQTGSTSCIVKPTSTGSGLTLTATAEAGSSTGTGSETGITVLSQSSSITAAITTSSSSVSTSSTFYAGVTVNAPASADATNVRPTISASGPCSVDTSYVPAEQNLGTITQGTAKSSLQWKLTSTSSAGTCSVLVSVVSDTGGSANPSKSVAVSAPGGGGPGGSSSNPSTGGAAPSAEKKEKNATVKIAPPGLVNNTKLLAAIEKVLAKGKMNQNAVDNLVRLSNIISGESNVSRTITVNNGTSAVKTTVKYKGEKAAKNYVLYEKIPKAFANSTDYISVAASIVGAAPKIEIVQKDPEYAIVFDTVSQNQEFTISYVVSKAVAISAIDSFATEVYAGSLEAPGIVCAQAITYAQDPATGECKEFPTPCDVPAGWIEVDSCNANQDEPPVENQAGSSWLYYVLILVILLAAAALYYLKMKGRI